MSAFHPDLTRARFIPAIPAGPRFARFAQRLPIRPKAAPADMLVENVTVPGPPDAPSVRLRVYRPRSAAGPTPALFWLHGGGYILGSPEQDEARSIAMARELGITVVAAAYRLAPDHPSPAAVEDAHAGLRWLFANADARGVDPARIAIGGASAGGGLAAALALVAHDRGEVRPAFQLLLYPMLDDRTVLRTDVDVRHLRLWSAKNNRFGWSAYLGRPPGGADVSPYAAPARREDLSGLPPAWIGVGTLDLFHDEDVAYAARLNAAGVPSELYVVPGAFHGFDIAFRRANVSQDFWRQQTRVLRGALGLPAAP
jgi:acetyl esterase/lipase